MSLNAAVRDIPMPEGIRRLPISPTGFPVPWFVAWGDGVPDFRAINERKILLAHKRHVCWLCGGRLGRNFAFVIGPMCAITRTISEPPSHRACAIYAAQACPFLTNPRARRNSKDLPPDAHAAPGIALQRNPGAVCVWVTRHYRGFWVGPGVLFSFEDDPEEVLWFAEGRAASRAAVAESTTSGLPLLLAEAQAEGPAAERALIVALAKATALWPPAENDCAAE